MSRLLIEDLNKVIEYYDYFFIPNNNFQLLITISTDKIEDLLVSSLIKDY